MSQIIDNLSTCTCLDCCSEQWVPEPEPILPAVEPAYGDEPPDTCDGYVSDGPYSCICACCTAASGRCPHRFTDFAALECWSGNCHLAAQELRDAMIQLFR